MQIGIVAKKIGLSVDAIRFYERNGLFPRPPRTEGRFRRYAENDVETLAFVRRVQGLGFKLSEIRGLLNLLGSRMQPCAANRSTGHLSKGLFCNAPDHLRWLPEGAKKRATHSVAISEPVLAGGLLGRESASLHHQPRGLYPKPFNCLGGGLSSFISEDPTELPRA